MSCIVLVGGGIGCGKSTLINFIIRNKKDLFKELKNDLKYQKESSGRSNDLGVSCITIQFDSLCSIKEQEHLMKSMKGMRNFRADLLMAAEHFISLFCTSKIGIRGPLTERSYNLLAKLSSINNIYSKNPQNTIIFVEDNFYYRSMRYDWFQIARRTNLGFATIYLQCPVHIALHRNSARGYQIPEDRIKKMLSFMEYPEPEKFKWEKMSLVFDSSKQLTNQALLDVINMIKEALENPIELVVLEEKIEAQKICSKNVVHQSDRILRKIVSSFISNLKTSDHIDDGDSLKSFISRLVSIRQKLFYSIKQGTIDLPEDLTEKIQNLGIESVLSAYEEWLQHLFIETLKKSSLDLNTCLIKFRTEELS